MKTGLMRKLAMFLGALAVVAIIYLLVSAPRLRSTAMAGAEQNGQHAARDKTTLDPVSFVGPVRKAYEVARENPELLSQLHCYCGCDRTEGHKSLLDCFRDKHGSSCEICVGEALDAKRMFDQGSPVEQIRDTLRARYDHGG